VFGRETVVLRDFRRIGLFRERSEWVRTPRARNNVDRSERKEERLVVRPENVVTD